MLATRSLPLVSLDILHCLIREREESTLLQEEFHHELDELLLPGCFMAEQDRLATRVVQLESSLAKPRSVVLQILESSIMSARLGRFCINKEDRFLHRFALVGWMSEARKEALLEGTPQVVSDPWWPKLLMILDRKFEVEAIKTSKTGHLAMVMSYEEFEAMANESCELKERLEDDASFGVELEMGLTKQQVTDNWESSERERSLVCRLFLKLDGLEVQVKQEPSEAVLQRLHKRESHQGIPVRVEHEEEKRLYRYLNKSNSRCFEDEDYLWVAAVKEVM